MNSLQLFNNTEFGTLGVLLLDGKEMFPATESAKLLGYSDPYDAIRRHTKGSVKHPVLTPGGEQQINFITEGDLYRLIVHSKLPSAERFEVWVFEEVLPSIRRHGLYAADELLANPDLWIQALQELKAERARGAALAETVSVQRQQIAEMKPKASYYDVILNCKDAVAITTIAKDYGKSGQWMNEYLHSLGIQFKQGAIWLLYQKHAESGYTCTKTHNYLGNDGEYHAKVHTYWTQKGRLFIYETLKTHGYLPLIEQGLEFEEI